jgi:hypothetical protein
MRIWSQLMASEQRSPGLINAVQSQLDTVVAHDTRGVGPRYSPRRVLRDQCRLLFHYDEREIIESGIRARSGRGTTSTRSGTHSTPVLRRYVRCSTSRSWL